MNSFINNEISKSIMNGSEVRNKFLKHKTDEIRQALVKRRNYCLYSLLKKSKRNLYSNRDAKDNTDNKKFSKTIKPFFPIKQSLYEETATRGVL